MKGREEGEGSTTKKVRKWDEGPSGQVKWTETLITDVLGKITPTDPLIKVT